MNGGIIQQAAPPIDIYLRPANRFVATFVGANNLMAVSRTAAGSKLVSGQVEITRQINCDGSVVAATRPEDVRILAVGAEVPEGEIIVSARIREVSLIGREMEIFLQTDADEYIKAVARPDPAVLALPENSPVTLSIRPDDLSFFLDSGDGGRVL